MKGLKWAGLSEQLLHVQEQYNDADILFRSDRWEHLDSDLVPFSAGRAINWAALRRKSDGYRLIAAGLWRQGTSPKSLRYAPAVLPWGPGDHRGDGLRDPDAQRCAAAAPLPHRAPAHGRGAF